MFSHDKVGSPADVYHPSHSSEEHGYGCFVDTRQVTGGNQQVAEYQHQYNYQCHISILNLQLTIFTGAQNQKIDPFPSMSLSRAPILPPALSKTALQMLRPRPGVSSRI